MIYNQGCSSSLVFETSLTTGAIPNEVTQMSL